MCFSHDRFLGGKRHWYDKRKLLMWMPLGACTHCLWQSPHQKLYFANQFQCEQTSPFELASYSRVLLWLGEYCIFMYSHFKEAWSQNLYCWTPFFFIKYPFVISPCVSCVADVDDIERSVSILLDGEEATLIFYYLSLTGVYVQHTL